MAQSDKEQVEQGRRLQKMLLDHFEKLFKEGAATPTDVSTLTRLLKDNGWTIDPAMLPDNLKNMVSLPAVDEGLEQERIISIAEHRAAKTG